MASLSSDVLCIACREFGEKSFYFVKPSDPRTRSNESWGKWTSRQLDDVKNNVRCPLCRLVYQGISRNNPSAPLDNVPIHYYRLLFGTYEGPESVKDRISSSKTNYDPLGLRNLYQTNRLHVSINPFILYRGGPRIARGQGGKRLQYSSSGGGVAVDIGVKGYDPNLSVDIHLCMKECDQNEVRFEKFEDNFLHGRQTNEQLDFELAKSWIITCADVHGEECSTSSLHEQPRLPSRLIDVERGMVVPVTVPCKYAALSYRWEDNQLTLNQKTRNRLTQPFGLIGPQGSKDVPLTITEAIALCCRLEIRYLWVDALCIMQDDNRDKQDQICIMDAIYLGAHLTIVSACGANSRGGLPGVRRGSRPIQPRATVGNLTLAAAQPELSPALQNAVWQTRAWTFQEAILSSRLLIFTDAGVFFRCSQELWHEDVQLELLPQHGEKVSNVEIETSTHPFWKDVISSDMDYWGYAQLVEDYTPRAMTNQSDGLNAFTGLANALEKPLGTEFFQGLPIKYFHCALNFALGSIEDGCRRPGFPSWSWCGWKPIAGCDYKDGHEIEICVGCEHFYRIEVDQASGRRVLPIGAKAISRPLKAIPAISNTTLSYLTDSELEYVLIFKTMSAWLFVNEEKEGTFGRRSYNIRLRGPEQPLEFEKIMGRDVRLPPWCQKRGGRYMQFITVGPWDGSKTSHILVFLIEKDHRGVSYKVDLCPVSRELWLMAERRLEIAYML